MPFELVYGMEANLPLIFIVHNLHTTLALRLTYDQSIKQSLEELDKLDESRQLAEYHLLIF